MRNMILSWVIKSKEEVRLRNYCNFFGYLGEKSENAMLYKLLDCNRNNKKPFVGICKWNYSISTRMKKYKKKIHVLHYYRELVTMIYIQELFD